MEQISAWVVVQIEWIMLLSGILTSTMVYAFIAPKAALRSMFGEVLDGPKSAPNLRTPQTYLENTGL
ncbi:MAG: hypothetical protein ACR2PF_14140 [Rhizobiaceae bacterium]